jgi:hypothetical protein
LLSKTFLGKEYIVNGALTGKNVAETQAPQNYGFTTSEMLCSSVKQPSDHDPKL